MSPAKLLGLSMATRAERGFSGPWRATAPTLSLVTVHTFSPCSFHTFSFPLLLDSPPCPRLLLLLHALLLPSLSHLLSPASSTPLPTLIISTLQAYKSDTVFVFSCSFSARDPYLSFSLPQIFSHFSLFKYKTIHFVKYDTSREVYKQFY